MDTEHMTDEQIRAKIAELRAMLSGSRGDDENSDIEQGHPIAELGLPRHMAPGEGDVYDGIDSAKFTETQTKADKVAQAFNDSAPRPHVGETHLEYRRRLAGQFQKHSKAWRTADLSRTSGAALATIEQQVYADAVAYAHSPENVPAGTLREVVSVDASGRRTVRFIGDSEACWSAFKMPARHVTGWPCVK